MSKRPLAKFHPANADAARGALREIVDRHRARLKLVLARNRELAEADAAEAPDRPAFDPGPEAENPRRYPVSAARLVNQTIKTYLLVAQSPAPEAAQTRNDGEPSAEPGESRTEPNTPPAQAQSAESLNSEPCRNGRPAPVRTEPNRPPDWSAVASRTEPNAPPDWAAVASRTEPNAPPDWAAVAPRTEPNRPPDWSAVAPRTEPNTRASTAFHRPSEPNPIEVDEPRAARD